jgi:hypothetical protein
VDPRSGEVISSHTLVWHDVLRLVELWYFTQVDRSILAPAAAAARRSEGELLPCGGHEVGHALGCGTTRSFRLFASRRSREFTEKFGNSASIMDYSRFNYVAQPGDNAYLLPS